MKHFIRLTDLTREELAAIFSLADELCSVGRPQALMGRSVLMFFPDSSLRTRVTFERGVALLGGQPLLFPPETLEKREELRDVMGYMANWVAAAIVRHRDIALLEQLAQVSPIPIINAMTDVNHPCEIMSDLYAISKLRDIYSLTFTFFGPKGNIALAWREAASAFGLRFRQSCPEGFDLDDTEIVRDPRIAMAGTDVVLTDSLSGAVKEICAPWRVSAELLSLANDGVLLNPCPPFFLGEEVSIDALESGAFVGYGFKRHLLEVQQAIIILCASERN